ncbi:MAG: sugar phosphate isomerase/epimerase [Planctomycetota bacterium]|nr:MAG: sugar phosphate isomerase/epimerase [Planctomycetota bacterium]
MTQIPSRRRFLQSSLGFGAALCLPRSLTGFPRELPFQISLAQWSLHRHFWGTQGSDLDNLDFAATTRGLGLEAVEYVNSFFFDKVKDAAYLKEMKKRAKEEGVRSLLIMCDRIGSLGHAEAGERKKAIEGHFPWVEAAAFLGCHSIRVNAHSTGKGFEEQQKLAADGLARLTEYAAQRNINVIVENHGGLSSNGAWLAGVMKRVDHPRCGTLPDFGNFNLGGGKQYDRYQGVKELMPYAKAVSAKSHDFDEQGNEIHTDYFRMMKIVLDAGYRGFVGIEYEGGKLDEMSGIQATKALLERVQRALSRAAAQE